MELVDYGFYIYAMLEKYGSDYMLKKEIAAGNLFQKENGPYSQKQNLFRERIGEVK